MKKHLLHFPLGLGIAFLFFLGHGKLSAQCDATIKGGITVCQGDAEPAITLQGSMGTLPYTFTYNINGGSPIMVTTAPGESIVNIAQPTSSPGTFVYSLLSVSDGAACVKTFAIPPTQTMIVDPAATADAGTTQTVCTGGTITLAGSVGGGATTGTWSAPSGTFGNPSLLNSTYMPSISSGTVTLTLTTNNPTGPCPAVTSTVDIIVNPAATANAGPPQTVCAGGTITLAGFVGGGATSGTWSAPSGTFGDFTSLTSTYTPSISSGTVTLTLTTDDPLGPCDEVSSTVVITVTTAPSANISYDGNPYCSNEGTATVTQTGSSGGTYSAAPSGLSINVTSGAVNLAASTPGTYTVTYTIAAMGGCSSATATTNITVTALPAATITYTGNPYCSNQGTATVTRTGTAGGTYSAAPAGLSINATTGSVTLGSSTAGAYTVTYTIAAAGGCPVVTATTGITVTALPTASISYNGSPYCTNNGTATVTLTGTSGGSYSATPAGLNLNASTGAVTLANSTPGSYTVTYTIAAAGGCPPVTATTGIVVTLPPTATISYSGNPYCSNGGTATVTQTGTTGGTYSSAPAGLNLNATTGTVTLGNSTPGNYTVTYTIAPSGGCAAVMVTTGITVTALPNATIAYQGSPYCTNEGTAIVTLTGTTGGTYSATPTGLSLNTTSGSVNLSNSTAGTYTVTYTIVAAGGCSAVTAQTNITVTTLPTASISYDANPYCSDEGIATVTQTGATGGSYSAIPSGLSLNATSGAVNLGLSTPGTYTVSYTLAAMGGCSSVTAATSITITALPTATIGYLGTPYCSNEGIAMVSQTGNTGGTYGASPSGLSINFNTGSVNLGNSTAGAYTVTYTIAPSGGCSTVTAQTPISITTLPIASINYAGSPYCSNSGTAIVTQTGASGGTYSASPAGLSLNSSTGSVNLSTSTAGAYTVTYTIAAAGGCAAVIAQASITVTALPTAAISYAGTPYCSDEGTATVTQGGNTGGAYSASPLGLSLNTTSGAVDLDNSTAGVYTVTYTIAAFGGCSTVTAQTGITVTELPAATISYDGSPYCKNGGSATVTRIGTAGGTFSASPSGLSFNASSGLINLGNSTPGTYTVTYKMAASNGCPEVNATSSVTVLVLPTASISSNTTTICSGTAPTINITGTPNTVVTYQRNNGNNQTLTLGPTGSADIPTGNLSANNNVVTDYTYTLVSIRFINPPPCDNLISGEAVTISVNPRPTVDNIDNITHCHADLGDLISFSSPVDGATYQWNSDKNVGFGLGGIMDHIETYAALQTGIGPTVAIVTIVGTFTNNGISCSGAPEAFSVTVNPLPVPVITFVEASGNSTADARICKGDVITLNAGNFNNCIWESGQNGCLIELVDLEQDQNFTVTVTDNNNCKNEDDQNVVVWEVPSVQVDYIPGTQFFVNADLFFNDVSTPGSAQMQSALWTIPMPEVVFVQTAPTMPNDTIWIKSSTAGPKTITCEIADLNGCRTITPYSFPVNSGDCTIEITTPLTNPFCVGDTITLVATAFPSSSYAVNQYHWILPNARRIDSTRVNNVLTIRLIYDNPGPHSASVYFKDTRPSNPCDATSAIKTVNTNPLPTPVFTSSLGLNPEICQGKTLKLQITNLAPGTYRARINTNNISNTYDISSGGIINTWEQESPPFSNLGVSIITLQSVTNLGTGCEVETNLGTITVTVNPLPTFAFDNSSADTISACVGVPIDICVSNNAYQYQWAPNNETTQCIPGNVASVENLTYTVTVTDANQCTSTGSVILDVATQPVPQVVASGDVETVCQGQQNARYQVNNGGVLASNGTFEWSLSDPTAGTIVDPTSNPVRINWADKPGTYQVSVTQSFGLGCVGLGSIPVTVTNGVSNDSLVIYKVVLDNGSIFLIASDDTTSCYKWGFERDNGIDSTLAEGANGYQSFNENLGDYNLHGGDGRHWVEIGCNGSCKTRTYTLRSAPSGPSTPLEHEFLLYPNPNPGAFTIRLDDAATIPDLKVEVMDVLGRKWLEAPWSGGRLMDLTLNNLPSGSYVCRLLNGEGYKKYKIFIIQQ